MKGIKNSLQDIFSALKTKDSFVQNFAFVFGSKSITFLIGFILTPVIARVFQPDAYGTYALYNAIVLNVSLLLTLKIPTAFVVIKSDQEFQLLLNNLLGFATTLIIIISTILFFLEDTLFIFFFGNGLIDYQYLLPFGIAFYVFTEILASWNVREKKFKSISKYAPVETIITKLSSLGIGLANPTSTFGLIYGELLGKLTFLVLYSLRFLKGRIGQIQLIFSFTSWKNKFIEFKEYPMFVLPSHWINLLTNSVLIFVISAIYTSDQLGTYSMAIGLISIPVNVIAYALQPILTQKIASTGNNSQSIDLINRFIFSAVLVSLPVLVLGYFMASKFINLFLGPGWDESARFVSLMMPLFGFQLIYFPLSGAIIGMKKNKETFIATMLRFLTVALAMVGIMFFRFEFIQMVELVIQLIILSFLIATIFLLVNIKAGRIAILSMLLYSLCSAIYLFLIV